MRHALAFVIIALLTLAAGCSQPPGIGNDETPEPFAPDAFNFLVVGDWGRNGFFNQREVGVQMGAVGEQINSRFTISTGDNFYSDGVQSTGDPKWDLSYEDIYTAPVLQRPWYVVLGNHDWQGNVQAQIDYADLSPRWTMPARYFTVETTVGDSTRALFAFIDTTPLADPDREYLYPQSDLWDRGMQLTWLDSTLAASDAGWKIVVGHHPVYSASSKVSYQENAYLVSDLLPIMERHGVQVYFAGHDHSLQHLTVEGSAVEHFVSGGGSLTRAVDPDNPHARFALRIPGFMAASMNDEQMFVQAFGENGRLYYFTNVAIGPELPATPPLLTAPPQVGTPPGQTGSNTP